MALSSRCVDPHMKSVAMRSIRGSQLNLVDPVMYSIIEASCMVLDVGSAYDPRGLSSSTTMIVGSDVFGQASS
jgi:hypothetical protein